MTSPLDASKSSPKTIEEARQGVYRRDIYIYEIPNGYALSYPIPREQSAKPLLAHFLYPAPAVPSGTPATVGRPRYWLVTSPREPHMVLFADCRFLDFAEGEGYQDEFWPRPTPPVNSTAEWKDLEKQLFEALDAFIDVAFSSAESLDDGVRSQVKTYCDLVERLTPKPLVRYLHEISPEFWEWAGGV